MNDPTPSTPRDAVRSRLVDVAARLLATEGPDAVTTRSVAQAAGVQAPTIYRLFGDKNGLLDAVAEQGFADYVARKPPVGTAGDPVDGLRAGWELHVGFGVANPALFRLMHAAMRTPGGRAAIEAGTQVLQLRVRRVAESGRLRVPERRAVDLIQAAGTGVVFTLIGQDPAARDDSLADLAWAAVCAAILTDPQPPGSQPPEPQQNGLLPITRTAAVTLRAAVPGLARFTPSERALFGDWLDRVAGS